MNPTRKLGWSLAGGGTVTPRQGVHSPGPATSRTARRKGRGQLCISSSSDGGATWTSKLLEIAAAPPDCSDYFCGWAYLGAQATLASDAAGTLYALWNAKVVDKGPARIYFAKSTNGGASWSRRPMSRPRRTAAARLPGHRRRRGRRRADRLDGRAGRHALEHLLPLVQRRRQDLGAEKDLSTFVAGYEYISPGGFSFPFGDYFELDIDDRGTPRRLGRGPQLGLARLDLVRARALSVVGVATFARTVVPGGKGAD